MGSIASNYNTSIVGTFFHDFAGMISNIFQGVKSYFSNAEAERELFLLDDHMLADIGLTRGEIKFAVRNGRSW